MERPLDIEQFDRDDAESFRLCLNELMGELHMTELELCEKFPVSVQTVHRWSSGESAPHPVMRERVVRTLASISSGRLASV